MWVASGLLRLSIGIWGPGLHLACLWFQLIISTVWRALLSGCRALAGTK